jgi:hypothetical protein
MPIKRSVLLPILFALVLVLPGAAVLAAPSTAATREVVRETASFTIPAGQCPNLPAGLSVSGTGDRVRVTETTVKPDGSTWITTDDVVRGTATDSNGGKYTFYYGNYATDLRPASGGSAQFTMFDLFLLQDAQAAAGNRYVLKNGFAWRWSYNPPADPFAVWPPANFQNFRTFGDPLDGNAASVCDPL